MPPDHLPRPRDRGALLWREGDPAVGLYIHVPFCRAICSYCTFAKELYDGAAADRWLESLTAEISVRERTTWSARPELATVFLGGGTPSALTPRTWDRLGGLLSRRFRILPDAEFTAEANPESFHSDVARAMRQVGVNRISLGSQTFDAGELRLLARLHDAEAPGRAMATARSAGFDNVSLDLMYGLPGQTPEGFARSLDTALALEPDHVSAYCLSLEPGTALTEAVARGERPRPDGDLAAGMYEILVGRLGAAGFAQYEISNFARPGRESRHNLRYWTREDVVALGPSAHALLGGKRWANPATIEAWSRAYSGSGAEPVPRDVPLAEARFEWVFLHLRLRSGLPLDEFARRWGEPFHARYGDAVSHLTGAGLLETVHGRLRLTDRAQFISDAVFTEFAP